MCRWEELFGLVLALAKGEWILNGTSFLHALHGPVHAPPFHLVAHLVLNVLDRNCRGGTSTTGGSAKGTCH